MNPLIPYIDSKNLVNNGSCYTFFDDFILVYHSDGNVSPYKIINDKIYLSSSSSSFPSQDSGGDNPPCEPLVCDNILNITDNTDNRNGVIVTVSNNVINVSGTFSEYAQPVVRLNFSSQSTPAGTYNFILNHSIDYLLYPAGLSNYTCSIPAGSTYTSCTLTSSWYPDMQIAVQNSSPVSVSDLEIYIGESDEFCSYGSSYICPDIPSDDSSSSLTCYSYEDIIHIPHSMSGLSPFYCFLAVVIFLTLLYVPYKIFIRPFFKAKL